MKAISILMHSIKLVFNNIDIALRISLVLYLAIAILNTYFQVQLAPFQDPTSVPAELPGAGFWLMLVLALIVMIVLGLWLAVAWHRFILLEEVPAGFIPKYHGGYILSYFGRGLLIGLITFLIAFIVGFIVGFILGILAGPVAGGVVAGLVGAVVALVVFYRLCPILPAAAVGEKLGIGEAMAATKGEGGTIILLAIIGGLAMIILQLPSLIGGDPSSIISLIYTAVIGWFTTLIGVSVLTTFYGHYIQKRAID